MRIIIINKDQPEDILPMINSLKIQNLLDSAIFIFDRCSKEMVDYIKSLRENNFTYLFNTKGEKRQTSFCRNLGYLWNQNSEDGALFLDADRWPVSGDLNKLKSSDTDIVLLRNEIDSRNSIHYGEVYNNFFSNGIYISKPACKKIANFYTEHREDYGNSVIFPENVQEFWGIEDTHLGDICYHLGLTCSMDSDIKLNGKFDKLEVDSLNILEERFILRSKLNVKW